MSKRRSPHRSRATSTQPDTPLQRLRCALKEAGSRWDMAAHAARRLEPHWQRWWVPAVAILFPVLLLMIAFAISVLR